MHAKIKGHPKYALGHSATVCVCGTSVVMMSSSSVFRYEDLSVNCNIGYLFIKKLAWCSFAAQVTNKGNEYKLYIRCVNCAVFRRAVPSSLPLCHSGTTPHRSRHWNGIQTTARCWQCPLLMTDSQSGTLPSSQTMWRQTPPMMCLRSCCLYTRDRRRLKNSIGIHSCPVSSSAPPMTLSIYSAQSVHDACHFTTVHKITFYCNLHFVLCLRRTQNGVVLCAVIKL